MGKDTLGEFELLVLLAAIRLGEAEAYAVSIVDEIAARTGRDIHRAAVYVTLQRLEKKGLIATRLGAPQPERGGKARRLVRVERSGREAVREARHAFQRMWVGLGAQLEER
ncbi:MAG: helix-turn-helix transcriptional regulator [Vicinamibacterales bacterium]